MLWVLIPEPLGRYFPFAFWAHLAVGLLGFSFPGIWLRLGRGRCAEIHVAVTQGPRNTAQLWGCLNKKGALWGFLNLSTWIVSLHPVCKKFHLWPLRVFWLFASFFILWLHILAMELCQILSLHPKPIISSAFSPLSFLAAAALQNSRELLSHRLVQSGPEQNPPNKTQQWFTLIKQFWWRRAPSL